LRRLVGGSGTGAAIKVDGGTLANTITIGKNGSVSAKSGKAIISTFGSEAVTNREIVADDVDLAAGGTTEGYVFQNVATGTYRSNPGTGTINLGSSPSSVFRNSVTFIVGGMGAVAPVTINGNFQSDGKVLIEADSGTPQKNDAIKVNGSATVRGII
jgi:hypothetical protein